LSGRVSLLKSSGEVVVYHPSVFRLAGNLDAIVVEAESHIGRMSVSSGCSGRNNSVVSTVNSSIRIDSGVEAGVSNRGNKLVEAGVSYSWGNNLVEAGVSYSWGNSGVEAGVGNWGMDTSGVKKWVSFRFSLSLSLTLLNNVFQGSVLSNVLGESKGFSKRSGLCCVVGWAVVVGNHLGGGSNRVGGDRGSNRVGGDRGTDNGGSNRVGGDRGADYRGSNMGGDHRGFVDNGRFVDNGSFVDSRGHWSSVDVRYNRGSIETEP